MLLFDHHEYLFFLIFYASKSVDFNIPDLFFIKTSNWRFTSIKSSTNPSSSCSHRSLGLPSSRLSNVYVPATKPGHSADKYCVAVVAGDWVYIDGGEFSFMDSGTPQFQYGALFAGEVGWHELTLDGLASTLLSIDLSQNWTNTTVVIQSTTKPDGVPNLNSPSLWYHESENLIYSGFAGWNSTFGDGPSLPSLSLWAFEPDGSGSGAWSEVIAADSSVWSQFTRPGQPLTAFGPENAWVLGGITSEWMSDHNGWPSPENLIPGMVQFNMTSRTFSNHSVQCCNATGGIYKGAMQRVPPFGPGGIHIAMGGQNGIGNDGEHAGLIDLGTVSIFDPTTQEWWNQTTTGSKPSPRVEFCTAGISSTDGTYEMSNYHHPGIFISSMLMVL